MHKISSSIAITLSVLSLSACDWFASTPDDGNASSSSASSIQETRNVLYRGTIREAGVSIFMQGTHRLELDDGRFVLLESDAVNLDNYVDERVEVYGSVRPTVEAGGMIMRVESVASLEVSSAASSEVSSSESSSSEMSSEVSSAQTSSSSRQRSSIAVSSVAVSSVAPASSSVAPVSSAAASSIATSGSTELDAKAAVMAKDNMAPANWTQQYCSSHIKFCIPVHKNWWYSSFGATASSLWHMEIGPQELQSIGDGPISVRLVSGSIASAGASDKQVTVSGGTAVGYRSWDGDRHFEVRGPANLEQAVRYITEQLAQTAG